MTGFLLFIVASILLYILSIPMIISAIFIERSKVDKYFYTLAIAIDQLGNVLCAPVFNIIFLKKNPAKLYGNPDETISNVTGVNYISGHLTWFGRGFADFLNWLDENHVQKAAGILLIYLIILIF